GRWTGTAWWVPDALLAVCLGRPEIALAGTEVAQSYTPKPAFQRLQSQLQRVCEDGELQKLARELFSRLLITDLTRGDRTRIASLVGGSVALREDAPRVAQWVLELVAKSSLRISDDTLEDFATLIAEEHPEAVYQ